MSSQYTETVAFFLFYTSSLRIFHTSTEMPFEYFWATIHLKVKASITLCSLLNLQHMFWLKMPTFLVAKISTSQMHQLFSNIFCGINVIMHLYRRMFFEGYKFCGFHRFVDFHETCFSKN